MIRFKCLVLDGSDSAHTYEFENALSVYTLLWHKVYHIHFQLIQQHLSVAFELLKSTGSVSNMEQASEMCFFISGQEALDDALGEQGDVFYNIQMKLYSKTISHYGI